MLIGITLKKDNQKSNDYLRKERKKKMIKSTEEYDEESMDAMISYKS
jgi:hypothetical protein